MMDGFERVKVILQVCDAESRAALHAVLVEYERSLPAHLRHGAEPTIEDVEAAYRSPNAAFLAMVNENAVGCVAVTALDASTAVMRRLYVRPSLRGMGLARALVTSLLDYARASGFVRVVLDTDREELAAAYALYLSMGFHHCEPYEKVDYRHSSFLEFVF